MRSTAHHTLHLPETLFASPLRRHRHSVSFHQPGGSKALWAASFITRRRQLDVPLLLLIRCEAMVNLLTSVQVEIYVAGLAVAITAIALRLRWHEPKTIVPEAA